MERCDLRGFLWTLAAVALLVSQTGCAAIAERVATHLTEKKLDKLGEITVIEGDLSLFRECLEARGGSCEKGGAAQPVPGAATANATVEPVSSDVSSGLTKKVDGLGANHPAATATAALEHPFTQKISGVYDHLRGLNPAPGAAVEVSSESGEKTTTVHLDTSFTELNSFSDQVNRATAAGGWKALEEQANAHAAQAQGAEAAKAKRDARTATFLRKYIEAYFENGRFVQVELDPDDLDNSMAGYLRQHLPWLCGGSNPATPCSTLVDKLSGEVLKGVAQGTDGSNYVFVTLGTQGFVTRDGRTFAFPGFQITFDPAGSQPVTVKKIDFTQVGSDLVAVFLQALFDAHEGLPAVSTATGIDLGTAGKPFALPVFDPSSGNVDQNDFTEINNIANRVEAAVSAATDRAVRGIGPFSLNNEALEELIVVAVGVTVRKLVEKGAWCWFACNLDQDIETLRKELEGDVKTLAHNEAERVKLRLRMR